MPSLKKDDVTNKMWILLLLLLPLAAAAGGFYRADDQNWPQATVCKSEGFFRHAQDCKRFFRCVDWSHDGIEYSIFHFVCPEGTVFDERIQVSRLLNILPFRLR